MLTDLERAGTDEMSEDELTEWALDNVPFDTSGLTALQQLEEAQARRAAGIAGRDAWEVLADMKRIVTWNRARRLQNGSR